MKYSFLARTVPILFVVPRLVQAVCPVITGPHEEAPCEDNVDSPPIPVTPIPTAFPTARPSASPSSTPSMQPTSRPSSAPTQYRCVTQDGIFGDIDSEAIRTIEYGYQIEATASVDVIDSTIIPLVENAITNSILGEVFPECAVQRRLRVTRRRLEVTGVSSNPVDVPVDDVVCESIGEGNNCVVVDGALSIYATTEASAIEPDEEIRASIKENMDAGNFDDVDPSIVRVTYMELIPDKPSGSESEENNPVVQNNSNQVLIGSLVGAGVLMAAVLAVAYRRRANMGQEDGTATNLADQNTATS